MVRLEALWSNFQYCQYGDPGGSIDLIVLYTVTILAADLKLYGEILG